MAIKIIPAILTANSGEALSLLAKTEGAVERVQIDIIDGEFAGNTTVTPSVFETIKTRLKFDYHLMVREPVNWVKEAVQAQGDRIVGQIEMMSSQVEFVSRVQEFEANPGLALDIETPVSKIKPEVFSRLGVIIALSVKAGFGGQKFDKAALDKVHELSLLREREGFGYAICDDGGVSLDWIGPLRAQGADEASVGRRIFEGDIAENIRKFQMAAHE